MSSVVAGFHERETLSCPSQDGHRVPFASFCCSERPRPGQGQGEIASVSGVGTSLHTWEKLRWQLRHPAAPVQVRFAPRS